MRINYADLLNKCAKPVKGVKERFGHLSNRV